MEDREDGAPSSSDLGTSGLNTRQGRVHMNDDQLRLEELFGVWQLMSLDAIRPNGEATTGWLGTTPTGLLVYDRTGYMCVQLMRDPREGSVQDGYYAYFGTFEIDERAHTTVHRVEGSLRPDEVGINYEQNVALSRDELTLMTAGHLVDGEARRNRIVWRRVRKGDI
jgi:hypothetical protein